uniref:Uncharacterized protein n=1 Tax=Glossina pallidipes TaxID=7398 RepID=A0A1B0AF09_GLOPL
NIENEGTNNIIAVKYVRLQAPAEEIDLAAEEQTPKTPLLKESLGRLDDEFIEKQEEDRDKQNEQNKEHVKIFGMQSYKAQASVQVQNRNIVKPGLVSRRIILFETEVQNIQTAQKKL